MKGYQTGRRTRDDRRKREVRKRPTCSRGFVFLALAWSLFMSSLNIFSTTNNIAIGFSVVVALPDVRKTSSMLSTVERADRRKVKNKIKKSLKTARSKDSCRLKNKEKLNSDDGSDEVPGNESKNRDDTNSYGSNSIINSIKIESILTARRIPVRTLLRIVFSLLAVWSFMQCQRTSGMPYAKTVWQVVYGAGTGGVGDATVPATATAAMDFVPTVMESKLAQMILSCSNDYNIMLPPTILPSAGALMKFLASIIAYIGLTFLLPHWSTKFRVLLDYRKLEYPFGINDDVRKLPSSLSASLDQSIKTGDLSVLVQLDAKSDGGSNRMTKSNKLLITPLIQSTKGPQKKDSGKHRSQKKIMNDDEIENKNYVHPSDYYFEVDHSRIYCNLDTKECIDGAPSLQTTSILALQQLVDKGGLTKKLRRIAQERYEPYNNFPLATPTFKEAFLERISSPLVVIQLVGRLVALLEEGKGALVSMCFTLAQHYYNAQQSIISATQLAQEVKTNLQDNSGYKVLVWKESKQRWKSVSAGQLVPGDIFRLTMDPQLDSHTNETQKQTELIIPVDALVLKGQCLTNEAILTGESVPQIKVPLDFGEVAISAEQANHDNETMLERRLDLHKDRSSILFAGTTLFHTLGSSISSTETDGKNDMVSSGLKCIALRTGTYSSKGRLLKALKGDDHVGAISNDQSEKDGIRMIASLSCCATLSCFSLFIKRKGNVAKVSPFRRVIQCTRIAMASIPSDLPLALASVARFCSNVLRHQSDVVCSEPGSLLTAAYIDTVVFDKTGTLTADTQSLARVTRLPFQSEPVAGEVFQRFVLAGCHSLVHFEENGKIAVVGDPLDQAALKFSGWKYNQTADFYFRQDGDADSIQSSEPVRLWQIRNFPFDPSRRVSSAIVLLQRKDSSLEIWKLTKGSPDTVIDLIENDSHDFRSEFHNQTQELEMQGYRCIAMGAKNLGNSSVAQALFPTGLSDNAHTLEQARKNGEALHRNDIDRKTPGTDGSGLEFCGFSCFDASTRPSSKRVVNELIRGGLKCIMLTGDSVDAALSVARKVEIAKHKKIAVLQISENNVDGRDELEWKILRSKVRKDGSFRILRNRTRTEKATISSVKKFIKNHEEGKCSIAANGRALELIFSQHTNKLRRLITKNLAAVSVIARATPEVKKKVVEILKEDCGKCVMMCGDGVNDVAAIQSADVAASLLSGFGTETSESEIDVDDKRRMKRLLAMNIGGNRSKKLSQDGSTAGLRISKKQEAKDRIKKEIEKRREEIDKRVLSRVNKNSESPESQYTLTEMKEMISATMQAVKNERERAQKLQKGGGDAARILAEERKKEHLNETEDDSGDFSTPQIKPGEASLVSSFSCLHPSVDGIDAILREGIATAASALATQQAIGLHSLMSCFHLATLYRDGFRYGNVMYNAEIFFYQILENARSKASCTPRPRLPNSVLDRPPKSLFQHSSILGILSQAIIHISCMDMGVRYAKHLENNTGEHTSEERIRIESLLGSGSLKLEKLIDTLSKRSLLGTRKRDENPNPFFQRSPFRPNYETNSVFYFSILQSTISALMNHKGSPFYWSVLECESLCRVSIITLLFVMTCITGTVSSMTSFLQLKPLPSRRAKLTFLGIVFINIIACAGCQSIVDKFHSTSTTSDSQRARFKTETQSKTAADYEEKLLSEERTNNLKGMKVLFGLAMYLMIDVILSSK